MALWAQTFASRDIAHVAIVGTIAVVVVDEAPQPAGPLPRLHLNGAKVRDVVTEYHVKAFGPHPRPVGALVRPGSLRTFVHRLSPGVVRNGVGIGIRRSWIWHRTPYRSGLNPPHPRALHQRGSCSGLAEHAGPPALRRALAAPRHPSHAEAPRRLECRSPRSH